MNEREIAIKEGEAIAAEDSYFRARPQLDCNDRRKVFQAGFERAWQAARAPLLETLRMKDASVALAIKTQQAVEDLLKKAEEELATAQARIAKLEQRASRDCPRCGMANQIEEMRKK